MFKAILVQIPLYVAAIATYLTIGDYEALGNMFKLIIAGLFGG